MTKYLKRTVRQGGGAFTNRNPSRTSGGSRQSTAGTGGVRPRSRVSVRAGSKYGIEKDQKRWEEKFSRLRRLSPKPFSAGSKTKLGKFNGGISIGTPYEELWKIARSSRDPAVEDKTKRVSAPFVTAMKNVVGHLMIMQMMHMRRNWQANGGRSPRLLKIYNEYQFIKLKQKNYPLDIFTSIHFSLISIFYKIIHHLFHIY